MFWTDFLLAPMSFRTKRHLMLKCSFGLSKAQTSESTGRHFLLFPSFSSTRPCLRNSPSCVSKHTGSSSLFSTTTSQLTESTDLPFQLVTPLHLPSAVGQKVSLLHSLPLLLAQTSMAVVQPERAAETGEAMYGADQRLALCPCSDASWGPLRGEAPQKQRKTQFLQRDSSQETLMPWHAVSISLI